MPFGIPKGAMCVQRFDDSLEFFNSHYLSHFAAFFIDARTKRSVVESFDSFSKRLREAPRWLRYKNPRGGIQKSFGWSSGGRLGPGLRRTPGRGPAEATVW